MSKSTPDVVLPDPNCKCVTGDEDWYGSPNYAGDPANEWVCDDCGRIISAQLEE